jgi:hypothetical protein
MSVHSNPKLFELASANAQRLALRQLLSEAPRALAAFIGSSQPIFHPRTPARMLEALSMANEAHQSGRADGLETFESSSREIAAAWMLRRANELHDGSYLIYFGGSSDVTFSGRTQWVPRLPVLQSTKSALLAGIEAILEMSQGHLAVVGAENNSSLVLDCYVGVLPSAPSPDEVVYELSFSRSAG